MGILKKSLQRIFKFITSQIFFLMYGKVDKIINPEDDKRIKVDKVTLDNVSYKVFTVESGRLYTDKISNIAVLLEKSLVNEASIQIRNNNLAKIDENEVLINGTPRLKKKLKGMTASFLNGGSGLDNYWHWIFEVLPKFAIIEKVINKKEIDNFLLPDFEKKFQKETLELLNIPFSKILSSISFRHIEAEKLVVTSHPYIFNNDAPEAIQQIPKWISLWLKKTFLKEVSLNSNNSPKKIYIDRSSSKFKHVRFIQNDELVKNFFIEQGFAPVKLENLSFKDQINFFNNADFVAGLHGAGFANLIFCKKNTKVLELKSKTTSKVIENLAKTNELNYEFLEGSSKVPSTRSQDGGIEIPLEILKQRI